MSTEIGILGGYGLQGQATAGDGSDKKGKMGAEFNNLMKSTSTLMAKDSTK